MVEFDNRCGEENLSDAGPPPTQATHRPPRPSDAPKGHQTAPAGVEAGVGPLGSSHGEGVGETRGTGLAGRHVDGSGPLAGGAALEARTVGGAVPVAFVRARAGLRAGCGRGGGGAGGAGGCTGRGGSWRGGLGWDGGDGLRGGAGAGGCWRGGRGAACGDTV